MQTLRNGLFLLFTALLLIACSANSTPEKAAKSYIDAVLANDVEGVMNTLYIPADAADGHDELVRGKLTMLLAETSTRAISMGGVKDISYSAAEYNNDKTRAQLVATIHYKKEDAPVKREHIALVKTDSGWKVSL